MTDQIHGFPFWELSFDKDGAPTNPGAIDALIAGLNGLNAQKISDVFIFSHGWNNDRTTAFNLYERFFEQVRKVVDDAATANRTARVGVVGVVWPSILWPDDAESAAMRAVVPKTAGGGVSLGGGPPVPAASTTPAAINLDLKKAYTDAGSRSLIDELTAMLERQEPTDAALQQFRKKLAELLESEDHDGIDAKRPDGAEAAMVELSDVKWRGLLQALGDRAAKTSAPTAGGVVGIGDPFKKLWMGAKDALRLATYWQMKERAGVVGRNGLGRLVLSRIAIDAPLTRVHLLGHSFGARLVSFSLLGMPAALQGPASPVKSLFLLQGAFSHYAFADHLPHDRNRGGALKGMSARVDGPLLTTHSLRDFAVGRSYPAASFANGDDAAGFEDQLVRWGAVGHDGEQAVNAASDELSEPGKRYAFTKGQWLNLDGNKVIIHGGLPSGAHSDIVHPHTAWAAVAAAQLV